ncbi:hypothetical protein BTT_59610 (plasmid) [Bacillus thuringiensis serovar morrisoni str. 4AA1]|nr:hypothetical protein BTT_59610 [Bacillus thuringiensis serovar morrisoni str. 4AA1]
MYHYSGSLQIKKGSFLFYVALIKKKSHVIKNATTKGIILKRLIGFYLSRCIFFVENIF